MKRTLLAIAIGALYAGLVGGALAQDHEAELSDDAQGSQAEAGGEGVQSTGEAQAANDDAEMVTDPGEQATSTEPDAEQAAADQQAGQTAGNDTASGFEEMEPEGATLDSSIASMQVSEVEGKTIVNAEDETLGKVEKVLRHKDAGDLHAVVSVGGFWIFGASDVALPLSNMQFKGEQLVLQDIIGKDELDDLATDYDEGRYSEVDGDMTLTEAMER